MARRRDDSQVAAKNYVLDTNVLLHDPQALYAFADNNVIIPIYVIEEIDQFKRDNTERGRNARTVSMASSANSASARRPSVSQPKASGGSGCAARVRDI